MHLVISSLSKRTMKNICQGDLSKHWSLENFITYLISGLIAYRFLRKNLAIKSELINSKKITLFSMGNKVVRLLS